MVIPPITDTKDLCQIKDLTDRVSRLETELKQQQERNDDLLSLKWLAHPLVIVTLSLGSAAAFALLVILDWKLNPADGHNSHMFYLYYMVPISTPFTAFILDRASRWREKHWMHWAIDFLVVIIGFARALFSIPFISGHALFLTYALLTARSWATRLLALAVMGEVIYLKLFVWRDFTLFGGMIVAALAALMFYGSSCRDRVV